MTSKHNIPCTKCQLVSENCPSEEENGFQALQEDRGGQNQHKTITWQGRKKNPDLV